jgi:two-component system phosphate regulon sensor histidine kinase PhoR
MVDEILRIIDEKSKKTVKSLIDEALHSGNIESGTDRDVLVAKDGSMCPISTTASPIRKEDGTIIGVVVILRDVAREREIDHMKTNFVSSVSHELRTPLTAIKAYAETMLRNPNMPEQTMREFLTIIDEESDILKNLIESLLEISRIESGAVKFSREPVDISAVINQVLLGLQHLADKKNIQLKTDISGELGQLRGDEGKIQSMVMNLVNNAIKFTPENGEVSISARREGQELIIHVSDTGMGIPKEALPKIFDRFYRVHQSCKGI